MNFNYLIKIFLCLILVGDSVKAEYYKSQTLIPVRTEIRRTPPPLDLGRTYNEHSDSRILAPKKINYPILDQMEYLLYPNKDFKNEKPTERLERLEIAVLGTKQNGKIKERVYKLKEELEAWQIANIQTMSILQGQEDYKDESHAFKSPTSSPIPKAVSAPFFSHYYPPYQKQTKAVLRSPDYDWNNYKLISPLIQSIGRRGIERIFK